MKIELDTTQKTIKVSESVNLSEFIEAVKRILPNGEWKEFNLETNVSINWSPSPWVIPYNPYPPYRLTNEPWVTFKDVTCNDYALTSGTYCIELGTK